MSPRSELVEIKNIFYEIIKTPQDQDKQKDMMEFAQQMNIGLTKAAMKESQNFFFQTQNIQLTKIVGHSIEGLKLIDKALIRETEEALLPPPEEEVKLIEDAKVVSEDPVGDCVVYFLDNNYSMEDAQKLIKDKMFKVAMEKFHDSPSKVARALGISISTACVKKRNLLKGEK